MKVLFFTPTGGNTGSEIALLNLIKSAGKNIEPLVICWTFPELSKRNEFKNIRFINLSALNFKAGSFMQRFCTALTRKTGFYKKTILDVHKKFEPALWYINTIVFPQAVQLAVENNIPFIVHCHEQENIIRNSDLKYLNKSVLVIANSHITSAVLKASGVNTDPLIIHPFPSLPSHKSSKNLSVLNKYGINNPSFIWLGSGTIDRNKDVLFFINLIPDVIKVFPETYFIWAGAVKNQSYFNECIELASKLGVQDKVIFTGEVKENYYDIFSSCDGVLVTSEKESFSIVALEGVLLQKPVISTDCGGPSEIINKGCGWILIKSEFRDVMLGIQSGKLKIDANCYQGTVLKFNPQSITAKWLNALTETKKQAWT